MVVHMSAVPISLGVPGAGHSSSLDLFRLSVIFGAASERVLDIRGPDRTW